MRARAHAHQTHTQKHADVLVAREMLNSQIWSAWAQPIEGNDKEDVQTHSREQINSNRGGG